MRLGTNEKNDVPWRKLCYLVLDTRGIILVDDLSYRMYQVSLSTVLG